ncbi:MAG: 3'-5' exoribonuclease [Bacteroidales bacterium]|nr:3'-5' exoribonuclease [Bacteroidales bacterium]
MYYSFITTSKFLSELQTVDFFPVCNMGYTFYIGLCFMENINFVAIDFETATMKRSSVCEIGLSFVEKGKITDTRSWLVKPENNAYNKFNIWIHGITPEDTRTAPEFDIVWKEIHPFIEGKLLIAHNVAFDMYVLKDVLDLYNLDYPNIQTLCSYRISKNILPGLYSYNLKAVSDYLNIELDHHRAGNDAEACAKICLKCFEKESIMHPDQLSEKYNLYPGKMNKEKRIYSGPYTKRDRKNIPDARSIEGDPEKQQPQNIFYGQFVVFTGTLKSMDRKAAMQMVADIGGIPENRITNNTNFLITGQQNFRIVGKKGLSGKQKEVLARLKTGQTIEILSEEDFLKNI